MFKLTVLRSIQLRCDGCSDPTDENLKKITTLHTLEEDKRNTVLDFFCARCCPSLPHPALQQVAEIAKFALESFSVTQAAELRQYLEQFLGESKVYMQCGGDRFCAVKRRARDVL